MHAPAISCLLTKLRSRSSFAKLLQLWTRFALLEKCLQAGYWYHRDCELASWLWTSKILRPLSFFELTSGFTLQGATGFSCCTTQHVALCLALATRTNEANEARKASQSRSLRSKSLKKRPGARIHDKTMCHQLFQLLLQGKSMGWYWNGPPVCKIASHTQRL